MILDFYEGCEIFITGGSGVVGKTIIEKLLRSCNVRRIYVLLRPKRDHSIEQRLEKIRNAKIFRVLRATKPDELNKLVAIPGDAVLPNLGITPEYAKVMQNVSLVFHCAATVRFDEPIDVALRLNVAGTWEALKFAETLKNLKLFMHVSTFFSNPYLEYVDAKIYPSPIDWKICLKMLELDTPQETLDFLTKKFITGFANTYTFTKNLAESVVHDFRKRIPVAIYRPSIVLFSLNEPEPGFPPSLMGAMGLFTLVGAGILKTVYIGHEISLDMTPQDFGCKSLLAYSVMAEERHKKGLSDEVPVYLSSSYERTPYTFKQLGEFMDHLKLWDKSAFQKSFLIPGCIYTQHRFYYLFLVFFKQLLPALLGDLLLQMFGRKPVLLGIVRKAFNSLEVMQPFMFNNYACAGLTEIDTLLEYTKGTSFDISKDIDVAKSEKGLMENCDMMVYMIREVLLNEDPETLPQAKKILRIKKYVWNVIRAIMAYYLLRWFYRMISDYIGL